MTGSYQWATLGTWLAVAAGVLVCGVVLGLSWGHAAILGAGCQPGVTETPACLLAADRITGLVWPLTAAALALVGLGLGGRAYLRRVVA